VKLNIVLEAGILLAMASKGDLSLFFIKKPLEFVVLENIFTFATRFRHINHKKQ
jgi:hypothetical protein